MATAMLRVKDAAGAVVFDSTTVPAGVCVGVYEVASGATLSLSFPAATGLTLEVFFMNGLAYAGGVTVTYPSGVPTLTVTSAPFIRYFCLFIVG